MSNNGYADKGNTSENHLSQDSDQDSVVGTTHSDHTVSNVVGCGLQSFTSLTQTYHDHRVGDEARVHSGDQTSARHRICNSLSSYRSRRCDGCWGWRLPNSCSDASSNRSHRYQYRSSPTVAYVGSSWDGIGDSSCNSWRGSHVHSMRGSYTYSRSMSFGAPHGAPLCNKDGGYYTHHNRS